MKHYVPSSCGIQHMSETHFPLCDLHKPIALNATLPHRSTQSGIKRLGGETAQKGKSGETIKGEGSLSWNILYVMEKVIHMYTEWKKFHLRTQILTSWWNCGMHNHNEIVENRFLCLRRSTAWTRGGRKEEQRRSSIVKNRKTQHSIRKFFHHLSSTYGKIIRKSTMFAW